MSDDSEAGEGRAVPPAGDTPDDAVVEAGSTDSTESDVNLVKESASEQPEAVEVSESDDEEGAAAPVRESALVGASAGSARAAARRSGVRAGTTAAKGAATRARDTGRDSRGSLFARLRRFLREVVAELRKVIWPARNQMVTYTIVVIVFVVVMVALTAGLDLLFAKGVLTIFG
ncbi:preprotein translocase subunit SecE [Nakamurella panacisegetis]|uniref:Protein translocase subunit SecE n=1 Tax=Nakamurella panacisegetis TaxID=1090615 RepID=A0A1H0NWQ8_9ACTN|nr:preprotein translocase subunit SecE [Nakamurella panacisegetis]SDO97073.1 preprotein translocase subunit SecE [Nakamurella panacisegetis]